MEDGLSCAIVIIALCKTDYGPSIAAAKIARNGPRLTVGTGRQIGSESLVASEKHHREARQKCLVDFDNSSERFDILIKIVGPCPRILFVPLGNDRVKREVSSTCQLSAALASDASSTTKKEITIAAKANKRDRKPP